MMQKSNMSCLPVVDRENFLVGIISEYDIMNFALSGEADRTYVRDTMTKNVIAFSPNDSLETIVNICMGKRVHRAPVVENGRLVGIISRRDILREMLALYHNQ
jgi:CBS domain-containing protein